MAPECSLLPSVCLHGLYMCMSRNMRVCKYRCMEPIEDIRGGSDPASLPVAAKPPPVPLRGPFPGLSSQVSPVTSTCHSFSQLPNVKLSLSPAPPSLFFPTARLLLYLPLFLHSNSEICSFLGLRPLRQHPPPMSPSLLALVLDSGPSLSALCPFVGPFLSALVLCAALSPGPSESASLSVCFVVFVHLSIVSDSHK